jgi:hypothetical protein
MYEVFVRYSLALEGYGGSLYWTPYRALWGLKTMVDQPVITFCFSCEDLTNFSSY